MYFFNIYDNFISHPMNILNIFMNRITSQCEFESKERESSRAEKKPEFFMLASSHPFYEWGMRDNAGERR